LACPGCGHGLSVVQTPAIACQGCGAMYPSGGRPGVIDFLPGLDEGDGARDYAGCWDDAASKDEIAAAAAVPRDEAESIFVKLPTLLRQLDLHEQVYVDLGCGYGRTLIYAASTKQPRIAIGVDLSDVMLAKARRYSDVHSVSPLLLRASVDCLPLASDSIDVVYSSAVLLHLPKETAKRALGEVARVLRPGGRGFFESTFVGWLNPDGIQHRLITSLASTRLRPAWVRTYGYRELCSLLESSGPFSSIEVMPEAYAVVPTSFFKLQPSLWKAQAQRLNARASGRLRFKGAFVKRWSVRLMK
jgi:SAM-dependent methyltransferase